MTFYFNFNIPSLENVVVMCPSWLPFLCVLRFFCICCVQSSLCLFFLFSSTPGEYNVLFFPLMYPCKSCSVFNICSIFILSKKKKKKIYCCCSSVIIGHPYPILEKDVKNLKKKSAHIQIALDIFSPIGNSSSSGLAFVYSWFII